MNNKFFEECLFEFQNEYKDDIVNLWNRVDFDNIGDYKVYMLLNVIYKIYMANSHKYKSLPVEEIQKGFNEFMLKHKNRYQEYVVIDIDNELIDYYTFDYIENQKLKNNE